MTQTSACVFTFTTFDDSTLKPAWTWIWYRDGYPYYLREQAMIVAYHNF